MYMPTPHNHAEWLSKRLAKSTSWKDNIKEAKTSGKHKATKATPTYSSSPSKLSLSKSSKSALITQVNLSDTETEHIIARIMTKSKEDNKDASLKYWRPSQTGALEVCV